MINIAIVEDDENDAKLLESCLIRYFEESGGKCSISKFNSAQTFLVVSKRFSIVFMDIELPDMDGMTAAEKLRQTDENIVLIFVTNMAQFAIRGYMVDALDFIVKPVVYEDFIVKLRKAVARASGFGQHEVTVNLLGEGVKRINISSIRYVEVIGHTLSYHTDGGTYQVYGTLKNCEELLGSGFVRCNNCYLVNLRYVYSVKGYTVYVDGEELKISQPRKKAFMKALNNFLGSGG